VGRFTTPSKLQKLAAEANPMNLYFEDNNHV